MNERDLFIAAVHQHDPAARAALLDRACADDPALRLRVEELLREQEQLGSFLERPAERLGETGAFTPPECGETASILCEGPGTMIGPYKLLEQIGEGGMGAVYLAQQSEPVKRLAALKVIKAGMDSRQVIARFEAERQALALMDHPHIAKVLDGGTTASGQPFFVMELVKGVPITRYCDEHRLTPKQRLELFVPVCQAVQHAHQKGIIHRDLKPSNVLVAQYDGRPVPKVIDFGIAKATGQQLTEHTLVTGFGAVMGTLEYMSPEQAELNQLDIDTRSDVYSLGVLLYELLTGTTPLERKRLKDTGLLETLRLMREQEPPRPSTRLSTTEQLPSIAANRGVEPSKLSGLVRGELDWIVMKALEKDRNRRYETANGFALDVQRYLADEAVLACPPSASYRFRKFARRNKGRLVAAAAVLLALVAGAVVSTWNWRQAEAAAGRAIQAERTGRLREAEALVGQARGTRLSRRPGQRFEALAALQKAAAIGRELGQPAAWFDPLRNEAVAALALPDLQITQEFGSFPPGSRTAHLSDDFELYALTSDQGGCSSIRRVADDVEVARLPELGRNTEAVFGAGRILGLRCGSGQFQLWDLGGKEPERRLQARDIAGWGFHPDGRLVGLEDRQGAISIHDVATGKCLHRLERREGLRPEGLSFHPTGPWLALSSWLKKLVEVRDWRTGAVVASATLPMETGCTAWTPDGHTLLVRAVESGRTYAYAFDPAAPEPLLLARLIRVPTKAAHTSR